MTATALLHPDVSPSEIAPFCSEHSDIQIQASLDDSKRPGTVLIFGGDGTAHRHLPQLYQYKIPALMVPKGSGNDFAKSLGIFNVRAALQAWRKFCVDGANVRDIDLGVIHKDGTEILFCCVAGAGLDSDANSRANRMPTWLRGSAGYLLAALQSAVCFRPAGCRVTGDDFDVQRS